MKGMWSVTFNPMVGYRVYRLRDITQVDHSGNREYFGGYTENKAEAEDIARKLHEGWIIPKEGEITQG